MKTQKMVEEPKFLNNDYQICNPDYQKFIDDLKMEQ